MALPLIETSIVPKIQTALYMMLFDYGLTIFIIKTPKVITLLSVVVYRYFLLIIKMKIIDRKAIRAMNGIVMKPNKLTYSA